MMITSNVESIIFSAPSSTFFKEIVGEWGAERKVSENRISSCYTVTGLSRSEHSMVMHCITL